MTVSVGLSEQSQTEHLKGQGFGCMMSSKLGPFSAIVASAVGKCLASQAQFSLLYKTKSTMFFRVRSANHYIMEPHKFTICKRQFRETV